MKKKLDELNEQILKSKKEVILKNKELQKKDIMLYEF